MNLFKRHLSPMWLFFCACLAFLPGCASVGTIVHNVHMVSAGKHGAGLGKTLVLALTPTTEVVIALENEWVRQLRERGIQADAASRLLPDEIPPDKQRILEVVKARGFDTVLVSKVIGVRQVERNVDSYEVAEVETDLYDTSTETKFWSAHADTFLVNPTGERLIQQRRERVTEFVDTLISEMDKSRVL